MSLANKILTLLTEKFFKTVKVNALGIDFGIVEVFKNPSTGDIDDILKTTDLGIVRIGVDDKGNVYAWKGDAIHAAMTRALRMEFLYRFDWTIRRKNVIVTGEGMRGTGWQKTILNKAVQNLKRSFPDAKIIEPLVPSKDEPALKIR